MYSVSLWKLKKEWDPLFQIERKSYKNFISKRSTDQYPWWTYMQKFTTKYYQNGFNNTLKRLYSMTKWDLSQGCKDDSTSVNQSRGYMTLTK